MLGRFPTKESVKRQRVVQVGQPATRGAELLKNGGVTSIGALRILGRGTVIATEMANGAPLGKATMQGPRHRCLTRLQLQV